jgi:hypothetical protein
MASKSINWLAILSAFVRSHPKTSATIAFNLGVVAAQAAKRNRMLRNGAVEIPAKLIELVPSLQDLRSAVPLIGAAKPSAKRKPRRAAARKAASKSASKTAARTRRKAAG